MSAFASSCGHAAHRDYVREVPRVRSSAGRRLSDAASHRGPGFPHAKHSAYPPRGHWRRTRERQCHFDVEEEKMRTFRFAALIPFAMTAAISLPAMAEDAVGCSNPADFATLEVTQNTVNAKPGPRTVPGRCIPVPSTASPQLQASIAAPYRAPACCTSSGSRPSGPVRPC
jgi:hypothetical protein